MIVFFFFFKQKTAYEMRISDWSSDVCSSDLGAGADPLLVVGTSRDPATPYAGAESMAEQLESAILVRRDGDGHTAYNSGDDCIDETIESYLVDGEVPDEDFVDCGA